MPGARGAPTFSATCLADTLSPRRSMASGDGPIHFIPAEITALAKSAFSAKNP